MGKLSRMAACVAAGTALLLTGIGCGLPIESARANDTCATAPGAAAPKGQHWYYRVDTATNRRCWYLHATVSRAAIDSRSAQSETMRPGAAPQSPSTATPPAANAASAAPAPTNASNAPSETVGAQPAQHVTVLNVKTVTAPDTDTTPSSEAATPEQLNAPPTPPISGSANVKQGADAKPVSRTTHATARAAADNGHESLTSANTEASTPTQTPSAQLLLLLLVLALGAAASIAVLIRMASSARTPRLSEHPEDVWRSYVPTDESADEAVLNQEDAPFLAPQEPYGAIDWDAPERLKQSSSARADFSVPRPRYGNRDTWNR